MDYNYKHTDFFGFDVEYIIADNTRLYRVSSLVNEVNKKHNVRVSFIDFIEFLRDKRIKQIIHDLYRKSCDSTIPLITFPQYGNKYAISGVIKPEPHYSDYLICEELLFQFLLWLDPIFVCDLYAYLKVTNVMSKGVADHIESSTTVPSLICAIYTQELFGKYNASKLIDLLRNYKDMVICEDITPKTLSDVLYKYLYGSIQWSGTGKNRIYDLGGCKYYIEDHYNVKTIKHAE